MKQPLAFGALCLVLAACSTATSGERHPDPTRVFSTSFESVDDFEGFFLVPKGEYDSDQELTTAQHTEGLRSHHAWILAARDGDNDGAVYRPHRSYPTIQLHKTKGGGFRTPCLVELDVRADMTLVDRPRGHIDDWLSFVTLSPDASDSWSRTILVNLTPDGYLKLVHVPRQGEQDRIYQTTPENDLGGVLKFPSNQWVRLSVYLDLSKHGGYAKVWQDGTLVSHAAVEGGDGILEQAHFGLYASAAIDRGEVYNDNLTIREVADEAEAVSYLGNR